jgi:hypothetical protein
MFRWVLPNVTHRLPKPDIVNTSTSNQLSMNKTWLETLLKKATNQAIISATISRIDRARWAAEAVPWTTASVLMFSLAMVGKAEVRDDMSEMKEDVGVCGGSMEKSRLGKYCILYVGKPGGNTGNLRL